MYQVECELADSVMRPVEHAPVLSVIIPTFSRAKEMVVAVESIANQVTDRFSARSRSSSRQRLGTDTTRRPGDGWPKPIGS
ncbi:MAG: hypothetical protein WDN45_18980 [Caulobacteraceae bacterium]